MANKKQLAGKKTKLAKLPLTQVLSSQGEETAPQGPPLAASAPRAPGAAAAGGAAGSLITVYLDLFQELILLHSYLQPNGQETPAPDQTRPLRRELQPHRVERVLRGARESLLKLSRCLSSS